MKKLLLSLLVGTFLAGCGGQEAKDDAEIGKNEGAVVQAPQGWLTSKIGIDELSALAQPGKWEGTHVIKQDDREIVSIKVEESIAYGNGGKCLVKFTKESSPNEASHSLQTYTYDPANDVYRHLIVFDSGHFLVQEGRWDDEKKNLNFVVTYCSDPFHNEISNTTTFSEDGRRSSWEWGQPPTVSPRLSGTGQVEKID